MMNAFVRNKISIYDPTSELRSWCREHLILDNPEYVKKQNMGLWTGNIPPQFCLYEEVANCLVLPFGCLHEIHEQFPDMPMQGRIRRADGFQYESHINLYPYQENAVQEILRRKNGIIVMPCGGGKGLPVDAKICTPTGWKRNGDLQVGDAVVGSDGKAVRVTGVFDRGEVDAYKLTFSDGIETVCDKDHLWTVQKQSQRAESHNWNVMDTQSIYEHYQNMKCRSQYLYVPIVEPVEFYCYSEKDLIMNPWLLGFLLGDGCFQKAMITMSTSEEDLRQKVIDIIGKQYNALEWLTHKGKYDWRFCGGYTFHDIESLGLSRKHSYEKFIPVEYLYGSVKTRLAILQGLFDADGHVNNGTVFEYCTTSKQLADDVVFIIESLGGTAKVSEKIPKYTYAGEKRTGRKAYRIFFKLYRFKPFTSEKHSAAYRERTHYKEAYRIIKKIEPCESITSRCITVDAKDQLYVTEHFVVTHNTQTALETVARIGMKALWLTHTQDLLMQSMNRAKAVYGCSLSSYGTITAGRVKIGSGLTFATVQTASKVDLLPYKDEFGCIIVDECAHAVGSPTKTMQFYKVLSQLTCRYKIGLTATPKRADGLSRMMFALIGGIAYEVSRESVKNTTSPVEVRQIETGYTPDMDMALCGDGTINYAGLVEDMTHDQKRFNAVLSVIKDIPEGMPALVLANRVDYLQRLTKACGKKAVCLSGMGTSKKAREERKAALADLNEGRIDFLFSTFALAKEGLDVPNLRYVIFATPEKDPSTVEQAAGRVARKAEGKDKGTVIDLVDDFGMLYGWAKKRRNIYVKKLGFSILPS